MRTTGAHLIMEPEWAQLSSVGRREGATLSPLIRQGWDGDVLTLRTVGTRRPESRGRARFAGRPCHCRRIRAKLTDLEIANGFANRHAFVLVRRLKLLPDGGGVDGMVLEHLGQRTKQALVDAHQCARMSRSSEAKHLWEQLYFQMARDEPDGLVGSVIARDSAQALRLSMIYALTDGSPVIERHHLEAAWSAWSYCRQSASWIFGNASGNRIVDRLWSALEGAGDSGLDRTQIHEVFGRNVHAPQINAAIQWLAERDHAFDPRRSTAVVRTTNGKSSTRWIRTKRI